MIARPLTIAGAVRDGFRSRHAQIAKWTIKHFHFPQHEQELMGNFRLKAKFWLNGSSWFHYTIKYCCNMQQSSAPDAQHNIENW
ncbi:MAG: hypothetical protein AXW12_03630 [Thalassospira sp. Nap_22]|nr:MAG: hypothetical protein AXW12_03630 [Thalassospira sp. Nap_22]